MEQSGCWEPILRGSGSGAVQVTGNTWASTGPHGVRGGAAAAAGGKYRVSCISSASLERRGVCLRAVEDNRSGW